MEGIREQEERGDDHGLHSCHVVRGDWRLRDLSRFFWMDGDGIYGFLSVKMFGVFMVVVVFKIVVYVMATFTCSIVNLVIVFWLSS